MTRALSRKVLTVLLVLVICAPSIGLGSIYMACSGADKQLPDSITVGDIVIDTNELTMIRVLEQSPSFDMIMTSNTLFTPGYSTYTPEGKEMAKLHEEIARILVDKILKLDEQYSKTFELNRKFNTNLEQVFAAWNEYPGSSDDEAFNTWKKLEDSLNQNYRVIKKNEDISRVQAQAIKKSLAEARESDKREIYNSLTLSDMIMLLLEKYATSSMVYLAKYSIVIPDALAVHTMELEPEMGISPELASNLKPLYEKEQELIADIIDSRRQIRDTETQICYVLEGLEAFHKEALKISITSIEDKLSFYKEKLQQLKSSPDKQKAAVIAESAVSFYESILEGLKDIDVKFAAEERPSWLSQNQGTNTYQPYPVFVRGTRMPWMATPVYASPGIFDSLYNIASKTTEIGANVVKAGASMAYDSGKAVVNGTVKVVKVTVSTAVTASKKTTQIVMKPFNYAAAGYHAMTTD